MEAHSVNENRTRDGRVITCEWFNTPLLEPDGRFAGVIALAKDVTEQKRAEAALEQSRRRFQAVFDSALDAILLMDDIGRCVGANPAACHLLGYSHEELVRLTVWDVTPAEGHARLPGALEQFLSAGALCGECTLLCKGGATRQVEYRAVANILPGLHLAIHRDVTERKKAEQALGLSAARLQALSRRLVEVQEQERRYLARELHDEIGQLLTSLKFAVEASASAPPETARARLDEARALIEEALTRARALSFDLRPALLDHLGLLPALGGLFERYSASTGVRVNFQSAGLERRFAPEVETAAYRIVQEALTNVARHARVGEATVRVWLDHDTLKAQVEDQGVGFDPEAVLAADRSNGLPGIDERVRLLGGRLVIDSAPGAGAHLLAELPADGPAGAKISDHYRRLGR